MFQIFLLLILSGVFRRVFNKQSWCGPKKAKASFVCVEISDNWIKEMGCESDQFSPRNPFIGLSVLVLIRNVLFEHLNSKFCFVFGGSESLKLLASCWRTYISAWVILLITFFHCMYGFSSRLILNLLEKFLKDFYYWDTFCILGYQWKRI